MTGSRERRGRVEGKVAVVTGAGSTPGPGTATGRATAIVLAREGAAVLLADVDPERAEDTRRIIAGEGGTAAVFEGDLTRAADCAAMVDAAVATFGTLDILVNNIGVAHPGDVVDTDEAAWDRILRVSLTTMFLTSKHAVPVLVGRGGGAIVNVGSISGLRGGGYVSYAAAKGGVHALTVDMAYAHGRDGVRVNAVAPGHITTPLLYAASGGKTPETDFRQAMAAASSLLGAEGDGWDVGHAVAFLASDQARWITGAVLPVDGGVTAVTPLMMAAPLREVPAP